MKTTRSLVALLMFSAISAATVAVAQQTPNKPQAQPKAPASASSQAAGKGAGGATQPNSNLGKQVTPPVPEVVRPKAVDVVEETLDDIEASQLTEDQMERIKRLSLRRDRQKSSPYVVPAKPVTRTLVLNLDPGVTAPTLRVTRGQLTSIVFSDATGQPWFIKDVRLNRKQFSDGRGEGEGGSGSSQVEPTNVVSIEPLSPASYGNLTVMLKGLSTPVIFVLATAQAEVDFRVDAKVPGHNPDAIDTVNFTSMPGIDQSLTAFLDGVPPKSAKRLHVTGLPNVEAWFYQEGLYLRTDAEAQYPAYLSAARSTSGKAVYRFESRPNSVTLLSRGKAVTVFIED